MILKLLEIIMMMYLEMNFVVFLNFMDEIVDLVIYIMFFLC